MAIADLTNPSIKIDFTRDTIIIRNIFQTIRGGATLDVTGFTPDVIYSGHPIINEIGTNEYKPMPVNAAGDQYAALPANHEYAGILISSILKTKPFAGILVRGSVNYEATYIPYGAILADLKEKLNLITFVKD